MSGISAISVAKPGKGENVSADVLLHICGVLKYDGGNIIEFIPELDKPGEKRMEAQYPPQDNMK